MIVILNEIAKIITITASYKNIKKCPVLNLISKTQHQDRITPRPQPITRPQKFGLKAFNIDAAWPCPNSITFFIFFKCLIILDQNNLFSLFLSLTNIVSLISIVMLMLVSLIYTVHKSKAYKAYSTTLSAQPNLNKF